MYVYIYIYICIYVKGRPSVCSPSWKAASVVVPSFITFRSRRGRNRVDFRGSGEGGLGKFLGEAG